MPTNLNGIHDNFDLKSGHVLPALLRKFHLAKLLRSGDFELLNVDDAASASVFMMLNYDEELFLNVGSGTDLSIRELAEMIRGIVGFEGELRFNPEYPDGTPKKLLDVSRLLDLGWWPSLDLPTGIRNMYEWYL